MVVAGPVKVKHKHPLAPGDAGPVDCLGQGIGRCVAPKRRGPRAISMHAPMLAIDTSTLRAAVALETPGGRVLTAPADAARRHAAGLVPAIRDLLRRAALAPRDLATLAVGLGPGSFTGLRVGLAAAKALAYATGCPLVGLDSLEAMARNAPPDAGRVRVAVDAQRGELYVADFARDGPDAPLVRLAPTRIEPATVWLASLLPGDFVLGPALERPWLATPERVRLTDPAGNHPDGPRLLELAHEALAAGRQDDPWRLEPHYLRRSAAEEKLGR